MTYPTRGLVEQVVCSRSTRVSAQDGSEGSSRRGVADCADGGVARRRTVVGEGEHVQHVVAVLAEDVSRQAGRRSTSGLSTKEKTTQSSVVTSPTPGIDEDAYPGGGNAGRRPQCETTVANQFTSRIIERRHGVGSLRESLDLNSCALIDGETWVEVHGCDMVSDAGGHDESSARLGLGSKRMLFRIGRPDVGLTTMDIRSYILEM
jgi:hypothetical protein